MPSRSPPPVTDVSSGEKKEATSNGQLPVGSVGGKKGLSSSLAPSQTLSLLEAVPRRHPISWSWRRRRRISKPFVVVFSRSVPTVPPEVSFSRSSFLPPEQKASHRSLFRASSSDLPLHFSCEIRDPSHRSRNGGSTDDDGSRRVVGRRALEARREDLGRTGGMRDWRQKRGTERRSVGRCWPSFSLRLLLGRAGGVWAVEGGEKVRGEKLRLPWTASNEYRPVFSSETGRTNAGIGGAESPFIPSSR